LLSAAVALPLYLTELRKVGIAKKLFAAAAALSNLTRPGFGVFSAKKSASSDQY